MMWLCGQSVIVFFFPTLFSTPPSQPPEGVPTPELRWTPLASVLAAAGAPDARGGASYAVVATVAGAVGGGSGCGDAVSSVSSVALPLSDASLAGRTIDALLPSCLAAALSGWGDGATPPRTLRLAKVRGWRRTAGGGGPVVVCGAAAAAAVVPHWRDLPPGLAVTLTASRVAAGAAPEGAPAAGVIVAVGGVEPEGSVAASAAASGAARVAWLADVGAAAGTPPTPLLLLDGDVALADLLAPGDGIVLPGAVRVVPRGGAPAALTPARGQVVVVVEHASDDADDTENAPPGTSSASLPLPCTNAGTAVTRPLLAGLAPGRAARAAAVGVVVAATADASGGVSLTLDDGSAVATLRLPPGAVPRSALAVRVGDGVAVTCARVRVERSGGGGPNTAPHPAARLVLDPLASVAVASLPRLPGLLASARTAAGAAAPLAAAAAAGGVVSARAACGATVAVHRTHADCGRPLAPAELDFGEDGGCAAAAALPPLTQTDAGASAIIVVDGGHAACHPTSTAATPPPPPPATVEDGPLWACVACGVDCSRARTALALSARVCLVESSSTDDASTATRIPAFAVGDAAEALLGVSALDFVAATPAARSALAAAVAGRSIRASLVARRGEAAEIALALVEDAE